MKIYGSMLCKDCVACCAALDAAGVGYTFLSITDELQNLKDFLRLRDGNPLFDGVRAPRAASASRISFWRTARRRSTGKSLLPQEARECKSRLRLSPR